MFLKSRSSSGSLHFHVPVARERTARHFIVFCTIKEHARVIVPALPPGAYSVLFELQGFTTLAREDIQLSLGFTATVNAEMQVATLEESVTVRGNSPVIDLSNTRVQQNFKLQELQNIPNARDMWSLLAISPSVLGLRGFLCADYADDADSLGRSRRTMYVARLAPIEPRAVTDRTVSAGYPEWSPRGDFAVCERGERRGNVWMLSLRERSIPMGESRCLSFSPTGSAVWVLSSCRFWVPSCSLDCCAPALVEQASGERGAAGVQS